MNNRLSLSAMLIISVGLSALAAGKTAAPPGAVAAPKPADATAPNFPKPVALPPPTERVSFRSRLRGQHPRIFFDAAGIEAFRSTTNNPAVEALLTSFLRMADGIAAATPPVNLNGGENVTRPVGDGLARLAFAYDVTHQPHYLAGARKWIHAIENYPAWTTDTDLGAAHVTFGMALAYDWLYQDLSLEERQSMETAMLKHARILLARSVAWGGNAWWGAAYFQNHCWINHTAISTAAMALYDNDPAEMQTWLDYTRSRFQTTYRDLGVDGGYPEGFAYLNYGTEWALRYIESLRSISGADLRDMRYLRGLTKHLLDMTMPDGRNVANFGDCDALGWPPEDEIYAWLSAYTKDGHAEWLRQRMRAQCAHHHAVNSPFALLWFDPSVAPKPPDDLPTLGLYDDLGEVVFRTSWKPEAAVVVFRCGPPGGHHMADAWDTFPHAAINCGHSHPDANSFLFWSDSQWRIAAPGRYTRDKETHNENVWMAGGKGQRGSGHEWFETESYFVKGVAQPHLVRVATNAAADYVVGEAAPAYEAECKLLEFRRHLLFVKGDHPFVAVYDRLRAGVPETWASYLHTFGRITVADNQSFTAAGSPPPTEDWLRLPTLPIFTPAYGVVLGPSAVVLDAHPLNVIGHPRNKPEDRGHELAARPAGTNAATWLVTVVGAERREVTLAGSEPAPTVKVGSDRIAWDADGNVTLNGARIEGNLLPPGPRVL